MDDWLLQKDGTICPQFNTGRDLMHAGIWLTHCHIQEHAEAGMMTTIEVKN